MAATDKLEALGRVVAGIGDEAVEARARPPVAAQLAAVREAAGRRSARGAAADASLRRPLAIGAALGAAASVLILWPPSAPLTFAVGEPVTAGGTPAPPAVPGEIGAWVVAPPAQAVPIGFSDGTRVRLDGGARVRVLAVSGHGARVAIERGTVRADVTPRADADWWVTGGPFEIHVTGTSFEAGWDPEREVLRVSMREGRVVVRAPCLDHDRPLVAGESATLSCGPPRDPAPGAASAAPSHTPTAVAPARPLWGSAAPASAAAIDATAPPGSAPAADPGASAAAPPASWRDLARQGDYKGALAAAEAADFGALCDSLPAAELLELGTTARLAGSTVRATRAYDAVRRRFAGSDAAATAAFHLGQMAFDGAHAYAEAHRWFAAYLAERPGGALAAEALGRTMEAEQRTGDLARARETAQQYLARYPAGAHADLAKSLIAP
jgi:TolA-binding protein